MIQDMTLRWVVTLLFVFSAGVCVQAIVANRHSAANVVSHALHAIMAVAMAVMAWPRGAELPPRAPMIFFLVAALWFAVSTARVAGHRAANVYHAFMMLAMSWMYAAMGGLNLPMARDSASMDGMPGMPGMPAGPMGGGPQMPAEPPAMSQLLSQLNMSGEPRLSSRVVRQSPV